MTDRVLILGANGRFGRHAADAFARAGWQVTRAVRPGKGGAPGTVEAEATDADALSRAAEGHALIVNAVNPPYPDWARMVPAITGAVIAAARASGATVLIPGNVYNYGSHMPERLDAATPQAADTRKGRLRVEMEAAWRGAGLPVILLRAGDFIDTEVSGNWFESHMAPGLKRGTLTYPGPTDRLHAWAYLPDMARAAAALAAIRADLPRFADIPFPGVALTGTDLARALSEVLGRPVRLRGFPWWAVRLAAPLWPMGRELLEMRYLWDRPHALDGTLFRRLLPEFRETPLREALAVSLAGQGILTSTQTSRWSEEARRSATSA